MAGLPAVIRVMVTATHAVCARSSGDWSNRLLILALIVPYKEFGLGTLCRQAILLFRLDQKLGMQPGCIPATSCGGWRRGGLRTMPASYGLSSLV